MSEQPDYTAAGEIYRKSMEESLAHLDKVNEELLKAKEQAIDQEFAAKEELKRIQRDAEKISKDYIDQHRKEYDAGIRHNVLLDVTTKLIQAGRSSSELKKWLDIEPSMIADVWFDLGFEPLGDRVANVSYKMMGSGGYVNFYWDGLMIRFPYEFGAGNTLATIDVPAPDKWVEETGLQPEDRNIVLEFVAKRILRDQAPDHQFEITAEYIHIYA